MPAFRFFQDSDFEFIFLCALGRTYYCGGDLGRFLAIAGQVQNGDHEGAYQAFLKAGDEAAATATNSERRKHLVSARQYFLWAANYYDTATYFVDGTGKTDRFLPIWQKSRDCWNRSVALFAPRVEQVEIPYEKTKLQGYFFSTSAPGRRPLLILNNGSDGGVISMWSSGAAAAVERGYHCLIFDGPGQGYALWRQKLYFRPDWEKVVTPVVDYAVKRPDVNARKIALMGISQGGYWVPRAVAFEHRIAAAVADPGVTNLSTTWLRNLPASITALLTAGKKNEFDQIMAQMPASMETTLRFRMRPYGMDSFYDVFQAVQAYNLDGVVDKIRCPMLITDPENEQFWGGQSKALYGQLTCPKTLLPFTAAEGADLHCEPRSPGLRDARIFDWLDETMA